MRVRLIHGLEREELEVVPLVKPRTLEVFEGKASSAAQRECVNRELYVCVLFFSGFRLVVEDVEVAVADLQEVGVLGDKVALEVEIESAPSVVGDVVVCEENRYLDSYDDRIIDGHEVLKRLMLFFVGR